MHCDVNLYVNEHVHGMKYYIYILLLIYRCGKVCLSLLGTWEGQRGEQWNVKTSTLLQVNIQSITVH